VGTAKARFPSTPTATEIATETTTAISIPVAQIGSVIGRSGANINQIRTGSGAKVKLHDSVPNAPERTLELSGTAYQVRVAQKLVASFLLSEDQQQQQQHGLQTYH
jgi:poly(rC)-binding protein 2/3/4